MENNTFFLKVWRFNAILIAAAGLLAVIMLSIGLGLFVIDFVSEITQDIERDDIVNLSETDDVKEKFYFQSPEVIDGTDYIKRELVSKQEFAVKSYSDKSTTSVRNVEFFNIKTEESRWLLPHHNALIFDAFTVYESKGSVATLQIHEERLPKAFVYTVVKADTNNDNRLTFGDAQVVAISDTDGSNYKELISGVHSVHSVKNTDNNLLYFKYSQSQEEYFATIDVVNREVLKKSKLPPIKHQ